MNCEGKDTGLDAAAAVELFQRRPVDRLPPAARGSRRPPGLRRIPLRHFRPRALRVRVGRVLRLVRGARQGAAAVGQRGRAARHAPHPHPGPGGHASPRPPRHPVHHGGAVAEGGPAGGRHGESVMLARWRSRSPRRWTRRPSATSPSSRNSPTPREPAAPKWAWRPASAFRFRAGGPRGRRAPSLPEGARAPVGGESGRGTPRTPSPPWP